MKPFIFKYLVIIGLLACSTTFAAKNGGVCENANQLCGKKGAVYCCAPGYKCDKGKNKCVFYKVVKTEADLKSEEMAEKQESKVYELSSKVAEPIQPESIQMNRPMFDSSKVELTNRIQVQKDLFKGKEKGFYVRCTDNTIIKVKRKHRASNVECDKHGGIAEYHRVD